MNAGLRSLSENVWLLYPTEAPAAPAQIGPYELRVAKDAPSAATRGLVAFSHGGGSTPWVHRGLLAHLARAGYAVVALEHPGNNRRDNRLQTPDGVPLLANLEARPRDLASAIELAGGGPVAVIGESIGGYTALALAGGIARTFPDDVPHDQRTDPARTIPVSTISIPVAAVVLLSPAVWFFMAPGALANVTAPILVRAGERDPITPAAVTKQLLPQTEVVANAGHFSFQTPFPPAMAHLPPAQDPPGFDRAAYQSTLYADIEAFLAHQMSRRT